MGTQFTEHKKVILGDEYDNMLKGILMNVLKELGGQTQSQNWGVGGSQEIETIKVDIQGNLLIIESETYIGLSISGKRSLVDEISSVVKTRLNRDRNSRKGD